MGANYGEPIEVDGDVSNSTHSDEFQKASPERFFEMFIADQQLIASAVGLTLAEKKPAAAKKTAGLAGERP